MVDAVPWICPNCRGRLATGWERWSCLDCGAEFRAWREIPDLRTRDDVYLDNAADRAVADRLVREFDRRNFTEFLALYFEQEPGLPEDLKRRQIEHIRTAPGRVAHWRRALGTVPEGPWLDLGCGTGSFLAAMKGSDQDLCGVDIALRWLLVARKRLDEEGMGHVPLLCACAEDLPFWQDSFAAIIAGDVIEHVGDQAATLAESHRLLVPGGSLFMASPNRFSLAPEPHVQVWGVGYLPRSWMGPYVRWRRGLDFRAIRTLGYGEWNRLIGSSPFQEATVQVPPLPREDLASFGSLKRRVAQVYNRVITSRPGQWFGRRVGPLFHVVCRKAAKATPTPSSRATLRGSRPLATRG